MLPKSLGVLFLCTLYRLNVFFSKKNRRKPGGQTCCNGDANLNSVGDVGFAGNDGTGQSAIKEGEEENVVNISNDTAPSPVHSVQTDSTEAIKMFVGQIPRAWQEQDIIQLFQDFGPINSINILRDKKSGESRGEFYSFPRFI